MMCLFYVPFSYAFGPIKGKHYFKLLSDVKVLYHSPEVVSVLFSTKYKLNLRHSSFLTLENKVQVSVLGLGVVTLTFKILSHATHSYSIVICNQDAFLFAYMSFGKFSF